MFERRIASADVDASADHLKQPRCWRSQFAERDELRLQPSHHVCRTAKRYEGYGMERCLIDFEGSWSVILYLTSLR
jgi:hypothetical protein